MAPECVTAMGFSRNNFGVCHEVKLQIHLSLLCVGLKCIGEVREVSAARLLLKAARLCLSNSSAQVGGRHH